MRRLQRRRAAGKAKAHLLAITPPIRLQLRHGLRAEQRHDVRHERRMCLVHWRRDEGLVCLRRRA
jgi:hypothetical protein